MSPGVSEDERRLLLEVWNDTARPYRRDAAAHALFEHVARAHPDAVALAGGAVKVGYGELDAEANRLARHLRRAGAGRGDIVAIGIPASADAVVAMLAVLKAGAAYLPLDPGLPDDRRRFMLDDASVAIVVTSSSEEEEEEDGRAGLPPAVRAVADRRVLDLRRSRAAIGAESAEPLAHTAGGDDPAYVIYTSGSTGEPKGVLVPHRGIVRLVDGVSYMDLGEGVRLLQLAPLSFDASVFEVFGPLFNGGTVVLTDPGRPFVDRVLDAVARDAPNAAVLVTPQLHLLVDHHLEALRPLRQLLFGGDVASVDHLRRARAALGSSTRLIHAYGPTESTVIATTWPVDDVPGGGSLPIGRPIENTQAYVLDERQQLVPIGAEGELCIGGDGLAIGYLDRPDLSARAFVVHPYSDEPGARLYRTGDRCRWLPDGTIEFLGRRDDQVKVRGHRIELGEVEAMLHRHPGVRQCVVVAREVSRDRALVAYVVPRTPDLPVDDLRRHAARSLAGAMCPSAYVLLDLLPMTRNGKVDREALPDPEPDRRSVPTDLAEPRSEVERQVVAAFRGVLELDAVGLDDEFADLGGTSLMFVDLHGRIDDAYPGSVTLADVVEAGTARRIARMVREATGGASS